MNYSNSNSKNRKRRMVQLSHFSITSSSTEQRYFRELHCTGIFWHTIISNFSKKQHFNNQKGEIYLILTLLNTSMHTLWFLEDKMVIELMNLLWPKKVDFFLLLCVFEESLQGGLPWTFKLVPYKGIYFGNAVI